MRWMRLGPSLQDWLLGLMSAAFTLGGLALALIKGERAGFATSAFFGGCTAVAIWSIVRKRRIKAHAAARDVGVRGYVPLRAPRATFVAWTGGMAVVGTAMALTGAAVGSVFVWIGAAMAVLGAALVVLLVAGVLPRPFLQFEPAGLRFGHAKYSFLVEWENLAAVAPGELHGHDLLLFQVRDVDRLASTTHPPSSERVAKLVRSNRQWYGADLVILATQYGTDIALLAHAIKRYVADPSARDDLRARPELEEPSST